MDPPEEEENNSVSTSPSSKSASSPKTSSKVSSTEEHDFPWLPFLNSEGKFQLPTSLNDVSKFSKYVLDPETGHVNDTNCQSLSEGLIDVWKWFVPKFYVLRDNQDCLDLFPLRKIAEEYLIENLTCLLTNGVGTSGLNEVSKS